jgi:hypothetical protein
VAPLPSKTRCTAGPRTGGLRVPDLSPWFALASVSVYLRRAASGTGSSRILSCRREHILWLRCHPRQKMSRRPSGRSDDRAGPDGKA